MQTCPVVLSVNFTDPTGSLTAQHSSACIKPKLLADREAPMMSDASALLLQKKPSLTPDQLKGRLMKTAFKNLIPPAVAPDSTTGHTHNLQTDLFTVGAALASTDLVLSPRAALDRNGNVVLLPNGTPLLGSSSVIWDTNSVFDDSVLWGTCKPDGRSILWGTKAASASSILWATSVLWSTTSMSQDSIGQGDLF